MVVVVVVVVVVVGGVVGVVVVVVVVVVVGGGGGGGGVVVVTTTLAKNKSMNNNSHNKNDHIGDVGFRVMILECCCFRCHHSSHGGHADGAHCLLNSSPQSLGTMPESLDPNS